MCITHNSRQIIVTRWPFVLHFVVIEVRIRPAFTSFTLFAAHDIVMYL
jgi:hypothetical protein